MGNLKAIAIKFIATLAILYLILGLYYGMTFGTVLLITLVLGIVAYLIGDLGVLPRTSNIVATLADFALALLVVWLMISWLTASTTAFTMALITAIGVAIVEYFFHKYLVNITRHTDDRDHTNRARNLQYQTEASDEFSPELTKDHENRK
ncbi:YndM family protein [Robertmurraya sp. Marseille-Q9965]